MAYEKHTWACGETITEAKLNNIEDGIEEALECCEGGNLFVKYDHSETVDDVTTFYFDKTWQEVRDALVAGKAVTANVAVVGVGDDVPSVVEGMLNYITSAYVRYVEEDNLYSIESVLSTKVSPAILPFDDISSPNDYLQITCNK